MKGVIVFRLVGKIVGIILVIIFMFCIVLLSNKVLVIFMGMAIWLKLIISLSFVYLLVCFLAKSIIKIEPTYKAILINMGKRTSKILSEGYHIVFPVVQSVAIIDCKRKTENFRIDEVFTPSDQAEILVDIETTWLPNRLSIFFETENPIEQLEGMISEAIRGFVADSFTKPRQWDEAVAMGEKFARMVVAKLMGFEIPRYDSDSADHKKGEHKLEPDMSALEILNKKETIKVVASLKTGNGELEIPGIGIIITRFNIKAVEPSEALRTSLEKISSEEQQQSAESIESRTTAKIIKEFLLELGYSEKNISEPGKIKHILDELGLDVVSLLRIFRVERGKATEEIHQIIIDGLTSGAKDALGDLARRFGVIK